MCLYKHIHAKYICSCKKYCVTGKILSLYIFLKNDSHTHTHTHRKREGTTPTFQSKYIDSINETSRAN